MNEEVEETEEFTLKGTEVEAPEHIKTEEDVEREVQRWFEEGRLLP